MGQPKAMAVKLFPPDMFQRPATSFEKRRRKGWPFAIKSPRPACSMRWMIRSYFHNERLNPIHRCPEDEAEGARRFLIAIHIVLTLQAQHPLVRAGHFRF